MHKRRGGQGRQSIPGKEGGIVPGYFNIGEEKTRPGSYFNISTKQEPSGYVNGVTAVVFRSDFGPLGRVVELDKDGGYAGVFGAAGTTDALREAMSGGAQTLLACRLGSGGACAKAVLKDTEGEACVELGTRYPGSRPFAVSVREKLTDPEVKECAIYSGTEEIERVAFAAGEGEAAALAGAIAATGNFTAEVVEGKENAQLMEVLQSALEGGADPEITAGCYSDAFSMLEPYTFNTICVDTEDPAIHLMLQAYLNRIYQDGSFAQAVVAETGQVSLEERQARAASYNDEKINYVLNPKMRIKATDAATNEASYLVVDGYQTAARIAGMIGAVPSSRSLTHMLVGNAVGLLEELTPSQATKSEKMGCIVLSKNAGKEIWIDYAINTLTSPPDGRDKGWNKIRRVKTRFEMLRRCNQVADSLIGKVDNDPNGRKTVVSNLNDVGAAMIGEGKLAAFRASESTRFPPGGDSCWFDIEVVDKDSAEHIYCMYKFQFSTEA